MSESQQIQLWGGSYANSGLIDPNHWLGGYLPIVFHITIQTGTPYS